MSDTVGNMMIRILRKTLQDPKKTAISDNDDTALLLELLNEAALLLREQLKPTTQDADITVNVSSRLTPLPDGIDFYEIYDWGWYYDDAEGKRNTLEIVSTQFIYQTYTAFGTDTALYPRYVYQDNNQIAVYPTPESPITLGFKYPEQLIRRTQWSDLWPFPDNWLTWMERYAQYFYEVTKGLGNPPATAVILDTLYGSIFGKVAKSKNVKMRGYRRIGNAYTGAFNSVW